jgi:hypothetical protein
MSAELVPCGKQVAGSGRSINSRSLPPRGRGLGRSLLSALESGARVLGVRHLTLGSVDDAVGFYEPVA